MKKIFLILAGSIALVGNAIAQTTFNYTGSIQTYTVPAGVTSISIDARGAQGGGSFGGAGGLGAQMTGTFAVTPGQVLTIAVGQQGLLQVGGNAQNSSGGGGGTFVYDATGPTLLVAAGGGGGKCNYTSSGPLHADAAGQITTNGGASSDGNPGGTLGNGGPAGLWSGVPCAGGGTGWLTIGGGPYGGLNAPSWAGGPGFCGGGGGGCGGVGGYGGGGGGGNHYGGGGGGGGYSGGGGGTDPTHGGGGGSYSIGTAQSNTPGFQIADGQVIITPLGGGPCPGDVTPPTFTNCPANIIQSNDSSVCGAIVTYPVLTATDNCMVSGNQTFNYTGSLQTFTVPAGITSISIDARGAQGGGSFGGAGGLGAQMTGTFAVTPGQVLSIAVGQQGLLQVGGNAQNSSGGGGGTFVYDATGPTLLVAAGGGGGKCNYTSSGPLHADAAGQITTNGGASSDGNPGGTLGNGGPAGLWSGVPCAGGGTGWLTIGGGPYGGLNASTWAGGPGFCGGGGGGCGGVGGYGGGGGGGNHYGGGGGGGGYSGGGGGTDPTHGGGGGSYSIGTAQLNTAGFQAGNGQVVIGYGVPSTITIAQVAGLPSGSLFPEGITTNIYTATDLNGNVDSCTFTVTVNDTESPVADVASLSTLTDECSITISSNPTATDNCAGPVTGTTLDPLTYNTQGTFMVTWTYDDGNGNTSTQTQTVTISDTTIPAADSVSLPTLTGCSVNVTTIPTATDNCEGSINGTTTDPLTYSIIGGYTVTWTYDDGNGNTSTQTQAVTVVDCSGINELAGLSMSIYPNPSNGIFTLSLSEVPPSNTEIKLIDALGQVLYSNVLVSQTNYYDFSYLSAGVYYLKVSNVAASFSKTIVIANKN